MHINYNTKIFRLQDEDISIIDMDETKIKGMKYVVIFATLSKSTKKCIFCKSHQIHLHDYRTRMIKHHPLFGYNTIIKLLYPRYNCNHCGKIFHEPSKLVKPYQKVSNLTKQAVMKECKEFTSFQSIARKLNISTTSVINYFRDNVKVKRKPLSEFIGVDEFKGTTSQSKYCFIIKDLINGKVIDILPSRKQEKVQEFLMSIPKKERLIVKYITMDLWKPYRTIFKFWFPSASIIADKFHYVRLIGDKFNHIRIKLMKRIYQELQSTKDYDKRIKLSLDYYYLKKYWKLIAAYEYKLENKKFYCYKLKRNITTFEVLDHCLNLDHHFEEAYYLRNKILRIFNLSNYDTIEKNMDIWFEEVKQSFVREYDSVVRTYCEWKKEIINSFLINPQTGKTMSNASTEGTNNICKVIKRVSFGYKNFDLLRKRILYITSEKGHNTKL